MFHSNYNVSVIKKQSKIDTLMYYLWCLIVKVHLHTSRLFRTTAFTHIQATAGFYINNIHTCPDVKAKIL